MSDDEKIWAQYAQGVQKIGQETPKPALPKKKPVSKNEQPPTPRPPSVPAQPLAPASTPRKKEPLDLRIERNLSLGEVVIEAKLDLHGLTESEAHARLLAFVETQQARGRRMLLVVTGRGRDGASVLKTNLPRWCEVMPLADALLAVREAAAHHGGAGAYYLLLRKRTV